MTLETITHADDPRLRPYRMLREADLAREEGLFVAEGHLVVERLLASPWARLHSVLIDARRLERHAAWLAAVPSSAPIFVASHELMTSVAGFDVHRGVLAAAHRTERSLAFLDPPEACVLALSAISNHDNIGSAFRSAAALGADGLVLDAQTADPLYRKAIRVSMGTVLALPWARLEAPSLAAALVARGFAVWALTPRRDAHPIDDVLRGQLPVPPRLALLVGSEGPGLDAEALRAAQLCVSIPMAGGVDSLNVGTAAAIALHAVLFARRR